MEHFARGPEARSRSVTRDVVMGTQEGLCVQSAALLAMTAGRFAAEVTIACEGREVSAHSLLALVLLDVSWGKTVTIRAVGPEAHEAVSTLVALFASNFAPRHRARAVPPAPAIERARRAS